MNGMNGLSRRRFLESLTLAGGRACQAAWDVRSARDRSADAPAMSHCRMDM
jgi:hypothetical protein